MLLASATNVTNGGLRTLLSREGNSIAILARESHHRAELIERATTLEGVSRAVDHQAAQKSHEISEISACRSLRKQWRINETDD
jgi:hypothetical protein